jgi:superfamily II helicase
MAMMSASVITVVTAAALSSGVAVPEARVVMRT